MPHIKKLISITVISLFAIIGCGQVANNNGAYVDVGGYRLYYEVSGSGSPTVIFENGSACELSDWRSVAPEIAKTNKIFLYDRAGLGKSDFGTCPRNASRRVAELNTLLTSANISPPYIIVAHSLGGILARVYQHNYPEKVVGLVLVDPGHEEMVTRGGATFEAELWEETVAISKTLSLGISAEALGAFDTWTEVRALSLESIGNIPLEVIMSTKILALVTDEAVNAVGLAAWRELQGELIDQSPQGHLITAEGSGHYVQLEQPQLVIDAIKAVLNK